MKSEVQEFLAAIVFYTRIPLPKTIILDERAFYKASKYLPLIGWLIGCFQALVFVVLQWFLPLRVCILFTIIGGIVFTGALHEDGLIDCCDAFGAGKGKDETLNIMKDSRVGAYGIIGYVALFFLKFELLVALAEWGTALFVLTCIAAQSLSRLMCFWFVVTDNYARSGDQFTKSKMLVSGLFNRHEIMCATACGLVPLLFLQSIWLIVIVSILLYLLKHVLSSYFMHRIGGYTGDCLGAVQQISELLVYVSVVLLWNCI